MDHEIKHGGLNRGFTVYKCESELNSYNIFSLNFSIELLKVDLKLSAHLAL